MKAAAGSVPITLSSHLKQTIDLAWPVVLARAGLLVMVTVDVLMIGRVSGPGLAHYGIAMAPFLFFMLTGIGLLIGTVVLVSQAQGAGEAERAGRLWRLALILAALYALPTSLVLSSGPAIFALMGQAPEIAAPAGRVLQALAPGLPAMLLFAATTLFLEGLARPRPGMIVMVLANVANAGLNAVLLFGWWGLPGGDAADAALATSITRWLMALALIGYVLLADRRGALHVRAPRGRTRGEFRKLVRLGLPIALANALESAAFTAMSMFAGWLGAVQAAAYLVCLNLTALIYMLAIGVGTAAAVRVGAAVGSGDRAGVPLAGWAALGLVLTLSAGLVPLVWTFRAAIASFYTSDPAVIGLALSALVLTGPLIIFDGAQGVMMGALRGAGDVRLPLAVQAVAYALVAMPVGYGLGFGLGLGIDGLIIGLTAGLATATLLLVVRFQGVTRRPVAAL